MTTPNNDPEIVDFSVALEPCDLDRVPSLVEKIVSLSKGLSAGDHGTRLDLLAQVQSLTLALETPRETMMRHLWGEVRAEWETRGGVDLLLTCLSEYRRPRPDHRR